MGPQPGEAIGLQFQAHAQRIGLRNTGARTEPVDPLGDAHQFLHMMSDLVGDHIGLRKVAGRAQARFQHLVKAQVDVDLFIAGAIERPHRRAPGAAGGRLAAAKQAQFRFTVAHACLLELRPPDVFGVGQHD